MLARLCGISRMCIASGSDWFRWGLDYTRTLVQLRNLMGRFRESNGTDTRAADAARRLCVERIRPMVVSEKHPYAFSAMYIRPGGGRAFQTLCRDDLAKAWPVNRWLDNSQ